MRPPLRILLVVLTALCGCATPARQEVEPTLSEDASASPVVNADQGLEVRWWVISDRRGDLARVLAPYADRPTPADNETLARWERSGLRLVAVPLSDLTAVRDALPKVGATNSQWLGEKASWIDALGGPTLERPWTVVLDDSPTKLPAGQIRLLLRAWIVPEFNDERTNAALHIELMPQHRVKVDEAQFDDQLLPVADRFQTRDIDSLRLIMDVGPRDALLVVPERPGLRWSDAPEISPDADSPVGPTPTYPTLGAAMLTSSPAGLGRSVNKAIIVLIPRIPDRFELTAR